MNKSKLYIPSSAILLMVLEMNLDLQIVKKNRRSVNLKMKSYRYYSKGKNGNFVFSLISETLGVQPFN